MKSKQSPTQGAPNQACEPEHGAVPNFRRIYTVEILALVLWLPVAALSGMAYDKGRLWPGIVFVGPLQAYPVLLLCGILASLYLRERKRYRLARIVALAPLIVALAPIALVGIYAELAVPLSRLVS